MKIIKILPLMLLSIFLNSIAPLFLKMGMNSVGQFVFSWTNMLPLTVEISTNLFIIIGLLIYIISVGTWSLVLSRVDVSIAYPMVSLGYIINAVFAYYLLGETLSLIQVIGIFVILFGIYVVAS